MFPRLNQGRFDYAKEAQQNADAPGPGSYDIKTGLLSEDPNKRYGFINKDTRFKNMKIDERPGDEENMNPQEKVHHKQPMSKTSTRSERDELVKSKLELEKWQDSYKRLQMSHEKDIVILEEKILKNDTQLQLIIKEKSLLSTNTTLKDKEINELNQREAKLRLTIEKCEKIIATLQEKSTSLLPIQKKLEDAEKQANRFKLQMEKMISIEDVSKEKSNLSKRLQSLKVEIVNLQSDNTLSQTALTNSRNTLAEHRLESEKNVELWKNQLVLKDNEIESLKQSNDIMIQSLNLQLESVKNDFESSKSKMHKALVQAQEDLSVCKLQVIERQKGHAIQLLEEKSEMITIQSKLDCIVLERNELKNQLANLSNNLSTSSTHHQQAIIKFQKELSKNQEALTSAEIKCLEIDQQLLKTVQELANTRTNHEQLIMQLETKIQTLESSLMMNSQSSFKLMRDYEEATMSALSLFASKLELDFSVDQSKVIQMLSITLDSFEMSLTKTISNLKKSQADQLKTIEGMVLSQSDSKTHLLKVQNDQANEIILLDSKLTTQVNLVKDLLMKLSESKLAIDTLENGCVERDFIIKSKETEFMDSLASAKVKIEDLTLELESSLTYSQQLELNIKNIENTLFDFETSITEKDGQIESIRSDLDSKNNDLSNERSRATNAAAQMSESVIQLEKSLQLSKEMFLALQSDLENQRDDSMNQKLQLEEEIREEKELNESLLLSQSEQLAAILQCETKLANEITLSIEMSETLSRLEVQIKLYSEKCCALQADLDTQTMDFNDEKQRLQDTIQESCIDLQRLEINVIEKDSIIEQLNESIEKLDILMNRQMEEIKFQQETHQTLIESKDAENTEILNSIQDELTEQKSAVMVSMNENAALSQEIESIKLNAAQSSTTLENCILVLEESLSKSQQEVFRIGTVLESRVESISKLNAQVQSKDAAILMLQNAFSESEESYLGQIEELSLEKSTIQNTLHQEIKEYKNAITNIQEESSMRLITIEGLEVEADSLNSEIDGKIVELNNYEDKRVELVMEIAGLSSDLDALKAYLQEKDSMIDSLNKYKDETALQLTSLRATNATQVSRIDSLSRENTLKTDQFEQIERKVIELKESIATTKISAELSLITMDKECNNRITELIKERDEARSAKTKQEIIHDNELLGVSKQCNYLEDKLHEKTVDSETHRILQSNMDKLKISAKLNQNALDLTNKKNIKLEKEKEDCKKKVRDMIAEKNLSESSRALIEQKAVFTTQLKNKDMIIKDLELKVGSLNEERISLIAKDKVVSKDLIRISEHSGILGHSNPNQKIQHVVELKETNINLKRKNEEFAILNKQYQESLRLIMSQLDANRYDPSSDIDRAVLSKCRSLSSTIGHYSSLGHTTDSTHSDRDTLTLYNHEF